ncbi:hypothetical protein ACFLQP_00905 [Acidobacteriota bacterium]
MKKKKKSDQLKGFYYSLENEKIRDYMKLTPEEKLQWLEAINQFTNLALNDQQREFREKLRRGEI